MQSRETSAGSELANTKLRVGVVCDFREEDWPSMDLVADMLLAHLAHDHGQFINATRIQPAMRMRFLKLREHAGNGQGAAQLYGNNGTIHTNGKRFNADRVLNRFWDYPRHLGQLKRDFDLFHVVDHSYGQVVHALPSERTIVTCHDLDTFRCLLKPANEPRSLFFKQMMRRTLSGFRTAARVICDSQATRDELLSHDLVNTARVSVIPIGVDPLCSPHTDASADAYIDGLLSPANSVDILHVSSTIPRKRIDVLLRTFARLKHEFPGARLLRVGGKLNEEQTKLMQDLGVAQSVVQLPQLDRRNLAAVYRRAAIILLPSEREGFGLPVVEAMACGTPVVASDLPVLREVGGDAAVYCRTGDDESWAETIAALLREREERPAAWAQRRAAGFAQASKFTWAECARRTVDVYQSVLVESKS